MIHDGWRFCFPSDDHFGSAAIGTPQREEGKESGVSWLPRKMGERGITEVTENVRNHFYNRGVCHSSLG